MPDPEKIHQKAARLRQKRAIQEAKQKTVTPPKSFVPVPAESRSVFHAIYPHWPNFFLWLLLPLLIATIGWTLWFIDRKQFSWLFTYAVIFSLVPVAAYLLTLLREQLEYSAYKTWRNKLGFPVNGWDQLGNIENFPRHTYWDELLTVEIKTAGTANTATIKLLEDVLYLFTIAASSTFYTADFVQPGASGDLRKKWAPTGPLSAAGSANSSVMGQLYLCIHQELRQIQKDTNAIEAVNLVFSNELIEVQPLQVSD
jgi:hypothetical protein